MTCSASTASSGCQSLDDLRCYLCLFCLSKPQQPALLPLPLLAVKASMTCSPAAAPSGCQSLDNLGCYLCLFWLSKPQQPALLLLPFWLSKPRRPALLPLPLLAVKASTTCAAATASSGCQSFDDLRCCRCPFWLSKPR
ncbi:Hypothetical predicted protein [Podarcis lilfordi]|uniref:Uncharacterized protein n=1 Tax=Podarcis lilfordi TaxID=74358 RepID=A0AA35VWB4_9SAUR|nr:Hypothetical predicted protein [Podarcis lilfordi]